MPSKKRRTSLFIPLSISDAIDNACAAYGGIPASTLCHFLIAKGLRELGFLYPEDYLLGGDE